MLKEIMKILENDARTTPRQISEMTGIPVPEVKKLIKQAEEDRIILRYKGVINWDKMDEERMVWAIIEVKVTPQAEVGFDSVAERISRFPQVRSAYLASGAYDLALVVAARTEHEIADFVSQKLAHIECVQGTVTHFILKRYKEEGEIYDGLEEVKRQAVVL